MFKFQSRRKLTAKLPSATEVSVVTEDQILVALVPVSVTILMPDYANKVTVHTCTKIICTFFYFFFAILLTMLLLLKGPDPTPCKPQALKSSVEWERIQQTHEIQLLGPAALQTKPTLKPPNSFTSPPNQIQSGPPVTTHPGVVNQGHYEQDMTAAMGTMVCCYCPLSSVQCSFIHIFSAYSHFILCHTAVFHFTWLLYILFSRLCLCSRFHLGHP